MQALGNGKDMSRSSGLSHLEWECGTVCPMEWACEHGKVGELK